MTGPGWAVGVVVPARDESARIAGCIASVRRSVEAAACRRAVVVVVTDRCDDDTGAVARRALGDAGVVVVVDHGNVGAARRRGAAVALDHLARGDRAGRDLSRTWLLTTDADTVVPERWVASHLRPAQAGAAAVAGVVRVDGFAEHGADAETVQSRFAQTYVVHADGTHPHIHGANLGVRADAYQAVGGWGIQPTAEDHALWNRLRADGWPVVSSIDAWVTTSGRRTGRAPAGFAADLVALAAGPAEVGPSDDPDPNLGGAPPRRATGS